MGIKIEDLTVTFRNHVIAINHADLEIPKGIFGLLGENGAGKTTLMRVLTTVLSPTSGTVTLDGILYSEGNFEKIQRKIGYLPQEIDLYPNLSVQECLEYMGDLSDIPRQTYTHVVEDLVATCNQLAVMKNGKFLYSGNMRELLEQARGHIWIYKTKDEGTARELEKNIMFHRNSMQGTNYK